MTLAGDDEAVEWLSTPLRDGVRIGRKGNRVIVEWRGIGTLVSASSGAEPEFSSLAGADPLLLEKFRATSLMACRRYLAGNLSLHGSAIAFPRGCVVLIGDRGAGKSTTAMALVEHHGGKFLADDIVPVDWSNSVPVVSPVDDSFWLAQDASAWFGLRRASTGKLAHPPRARALTPERLGGIVHLVFDETAEDCVLRRVTGHDAFVLLSGSHVCYSGGGEDDALRNFATRARLAAGTKLFELRRRRSLQALGRALELLADCVGNPRPLGDPSRPADDQMSRRRG
jgi:hypothetical protein